MICSATYRIAVICSNLLHLLPFLVIHPHSDHNYAFLHVPAIPSCLLLHFPDFILTVLFVCFRLAAVPPLLLHPSVSTQHLHLKQVE